METWKQWLLEIISICGIRFVQPLDDTKVKPNVHPEQCCHRRQGMNLAKVLKHLEQLEPLQFWNILTLAAAGSSHPCFQQMILWTLKYWNSSHVWVCVLLTKRPSSHQHINCPYVPSKLSKERSARHAVSQSSHHRRLSLLKGRERDTEGTKSITAIMGLWRVTCGLGH